MSTDMPVFNRFSIDDVVESIVVEVICFDDNGIVGAGRCVGIVCSCNDEVVVFGGPKIESKKSKSGNDVVDIIFDVIGTIAFCCFIFGSKKSAGTGIKSPKPDVVVIVCCCVVGRIVVVRSNVVSNIGTNVGSITGSIVGSIFIAASTSSKDIFGDSIAF